MSPVRKTVLWLLLAPALLYVFACAMLYATQRNYIYFPVPRMNSAVPTLPLPVGGDTLVVSMRALPGDKAVVYFGGNAEDVSQSVPDLGLVFPDRAIYALHFRGYGGSPGAPNEADLVRDGLALFDRVLADHADVVVIGRSLGSGVATQVAAARPASRVVLVTPYDSMADVAQTHYPWFPARWMTKDRFDSFHAAPRIAAPTTVIAADQDTIVPMARTQRLLTGFRPGVATFVVLRGAGHNFAPTPEYEAALRGDVGARHGKASP